MYISSFFGSVAKISIPALGGTANLEFGWTSTPGSVDSASEVHAAQLEFGGRLYRTKYGSYSTEGQSAFVQEGDANGTGFTSLVGASGFDKSTENHPRPHAHPIALANTARRPCRSLGRKAVHHQQRTVWIRVRHLRSPRRGFRQCLSHRAPRLSLRPRLWSQWTAHIPDGTATPRTAPAAQIWFPARTLPWRAPSSCPAREACSLSPPTATGLPTKAAAPEVLCTTIPTGCRWWPTTSLTSWAERTPANLAPTPGGNGTAEGSTGTHALETSR